MTTMIVIRKSGNAMDVSPDGKSKLPDAVRKLIEPELRYKLLIAVRGKDAYDKHGIRRPFREELKILYKYDAYGRLVCGIGFLSRVSQILIQAGYSIIIEECDPIHERPDRFHTDWNNVFDNFTFRVKQQDMLSIIEKNERGIVSAPTGVGKTFLYKALCLLFNKANIVITTKRKDIAQAIVSELSKDIPNVGLVGAGKKLHGRVTICTAGSLHRLDPSIVDIVVGEEVHELAAPTYASKLSVFRRSRMFGFTATPTGRLDNANIRLESLFGPIIFHMSYQEAVSHNLVVPIRVKWLDMAMKNPAEGYIETAKQRHGIWRNEQRNYKIANAVNTFAEDEQVLIMVTTLEHAVYLKQYLPNFTLCYAEKDNTALDKYKRKELLSDDEPTMTTARRQALRKQFEAGTLKKVIATDVWSTGVSFNSLAVLIRGDARGSTIMDSQIPGRVCRKHEASGKTYGLVIDCLDQFDIALKNSARKRRLNYESKGWQQEFPTSRL